MEEPQLSQIRNRGKSASLRGLSFKDLSNSTVVEADESSPKKVVVPGKPKNKFERVKFALYKVFRYIGIGPIAFLYELVLFLWQRGRVLAVLISVATELLLLRSEVYKRLIMRDMYIGRGNLFRFSLQMLLVIVAISSFIYVATSRNSVDSTVEIALADMKYDGPITYGDLLVPVQAAPIEYTSATTLAPTQYIVRGGDTLSTIAANNGISVDTLMWANELTETSVIKPGNELSIPPGDGVMVDVASGDSVEGLAEKYSTSAQLIIEANELRQPYTLAAGEQLFLPDGIEPNPVQPEPTVQAPIYSGRIASAPSSTPVPAPTPTTASRWLRWPVANGGRLTQCYSGWHNGLDIADRSYPDIVAAAPGVVSFSGCQSGYCPAPGYETGGAGLAWTVMVDHGNGLTTIYGHLNQLYVSSGQTVAAGTPIGQMGQSGLSFGVHLHFMVVNTGTWVSHNPAQYLSTSVCGY